MSEKKCIVCNSKGEVIFEKCLCGNEKISCCGNCVTILNEDLEYLKHNHPEQMEEDCCKSLE